MKVILLRDVAKIGRRFEIKEVPDGYAQNSLIPKKDAEPATPANVKRVLELSKKTARTNEATIEEAKKLSEESIATPLVIKMEANDQGHLFQGVHANEIVAAAIARGLTLVKEQVHIQEAIKALGDHTVHIRAVGKEFPLKIEVVAK
jgi:large subunit ribosomal protein L9